MTKNQSLENKVEKRFNLKEKLKKGAASLLVGASLLGLAGCATTNSNAYAQEQKPAQQYEEVNYEHTNLLYSDKVVGKPNFDNGKVVFSAILSKSNAEIFISNRDGTGNKRLTCTKDEFESGPFWTADHKIVYLSRNETNKTVKPYVIESDGKNKREITLGLYSALAEEKGIDILKDLH